MVYMELGTKLFRVLMQEMTGGKVRRVPIMQVNEKLPKGYSATISFYSGTEYSPGFTECQFYNNNGAKCGTHIKRGRILGEYMTKDKDGVECSLKICDKC